MSERSPDSAGAAPFGGYSDDAAQRLGCELVHLTPGQARLRMRVSPEMLQGHGTCHGGFVFLLADTAFAYACNSQGVPTVAAAADIVYLEPAHLDDVLIADAAERAVWGRNGLYDVTVRRESDSAVLAEFRGRSRAVPWRDR
jgi:acyl-CoA thioesterase